MIIWLGITDLTQFVEFVYWPVRKLEGDCVEPIQTGDSSDASFFSVYGKKVDGTEETVADFSTLQEASGYCLMLNHSAFGHLPDYGHIDKEEK